MSEEEDEDEDLEPPTTEETHIPQDSIEKEGISHDDSGAPAHTFRQETILEEKELGDSKRHHVSENLDADKEYPQMKGGSQLALVMTTPTMGEWRKVEKKKWRKG